MPEFQNLSGRRFGDLTVSGPHVVVNKRTVWPCACACGGAKDVAAGHLVSGHTTSCGCRAKNSPNAKTHGMRKTPEYTCWINLRNRCLNRKHKSFKDYGGRGIKVCKRWIGREGFANFIADVGRKPSPNHELDRKDNDGDYCPKNCHWVTRRQNSRNKRNTRMLSYKGETLCMTDWTRRLKLFPSTIPDLLAKGVPFESIAALLVK